MIEFKPTFYIPNRYIFSSRKVILAGGALRPLFDKKDKIEDFDLFFLKGADIEDIKEYLEDEHFNKVFQCPQGKLTTYKNSLGQKIQLITEKYYSSMEAIIDDFDINAGRIAFDGKTIITEKSVIRDIKRKEVNLHRVSYPNATFKRMLKYRDKGYTITNEAIATYTDSIFREGIKSANLELVDDGSMWRFYID